MALSLCDAEDIVQEAQIEASRRGFRGAPRAFLAFEKRIVRFKVLNQARSESREKRCESEFSGLDAIIGTGDEPLANEPLPERAVEAKERSAALAAALSMISSLDAEIILSHYFDELTFAQIASGLGLSPGAARMRAQRAIESLRFRLKE
jgi:RNA polymerase sigma factor (sigma-70 family)